MHRFIFGRILGRQQKLGSQANLASWREVTTTRDSKILLLHLGNSRGGQKIAETEIEIK